MVFENLETVLFVHSRQGENSSSGVLFSFL